MLRSASGVSRAPAVSYALYLPSHLPDDRRIPLLILLDARGRALVPLSALSGDDAAALEALRRAVAAGFCDRRRLETEPDLARMHGDPGFEGLLEAAPR